MNIRGTIDGYKNYVTHLREARPGQEVAQDLGRYNSFYRNPIAAHAAIGSGFGVVGALTNSDPNKDVGDVVGAVFNTLALGGLGAGVGALQGLGAEAKNINQIQLASLKAGMSGKALTGMYGAFSDSQLTDPIVDAEAAKRNLLSRVWDVVRGDTTRFKPNLHYKDWKAAKAAGQGQPAGTPVGEQVNPVSDGAAAGSAQATAAAAEATGAPVVPSSEKKDAADGSKPTQKVYRTKEEAQAAGVVPREGYGKEIGYTDPKTPEQRADEKKRNGFNAGPGAPPAAAPVKKTRTEAPPDPLVGTGTDSVAQARAVAEANVAEQQSAVDFTGMTKQGLRDHMSANGIPALGSKATKQNLLDAINAHSQQARAQEVAAAAAAPPSSVDQMKSPLPTFSADDMRARGNQVTEWLNSRNPSPERMAKFSDVGYIPSWAKDDPTLGMMASLGRQASYELNNDPGVIPSGLSSNQAISFLNRVNQLGNTSAAADPLRPPSAAEIEDAARASQYDIGVNSDYDSYPGIGDIGDDTPPSTKRPVRRPR
jgi:hypothetical protein